MMQFLQQQMLQSLGNLVFDGINPGLLQYARGIDPGLRQQVAKTGILYFESGFLEAFGGSVWHARRHTSSYRITVLPRYARPTRMSASGTKRTSRHVHSTVAMRRKADMGNL